MPEPFPAAPVATSTARQAFEDVMEDSGATLPSRDSVDQRIVAQVRSGTGHLLKSPDEAGPRPAYAAASAAD